MTAQIVNFPGSPEPMQTVEAALASASEVGLRSVVVIGLDRDGKGHMLVSDMDGPTMLWLLEWSKSCLMSHIV